VGYVGFQWLMQQQAIAFGRDYASRTGVDARRVTAVPRPVSPFNWTVLVEDAEQYSYAHVNLVRTRVLRESGDDTGFIERLNAPYRPLAEAQWIAASLYGSTPAEQALVREAYSQADFRFFRWFAAYPSLLKIEVGNPSACVWFQDLRFITPGRATLPFRYGMCRENGGAWQPFQLIDEERRPLF
jgi:inner membrane protein